MSGLILIIIIIFVIVPLIKKFKESFDASETKNRNRYGNYRSGGYGGYNNPNIYNDQNNKKITYDWKPDYNFLSNPSEQGNQGNTSNQTNQANQSMQSNPSNQLNQSNQGNQSNQSNQGSQGHNAANVQINDYNRNTSVQTGTGGIAPAANARPSSSVASAKASTPAANARPSSLSASAKPSSTKTNAQPFSAAVSGGKSAAAEQNMSRKKTTAAEIRKEQHRNQDAGQTASDNIADVHFTDSFLGEDFKMPDYNSFEISTSLYEMPESDAFRSTDVIVDSEVKIDAVAPSLEYNVKNDGQI